MARMAQMEEEEFLHGWTGFIKRREEDKHKGHKGTKAQREEKRIREELAADGADGADEEKRRIITWMDRINRMMIVKGDRKALGAAGEDAAARALRRSGHRIVARNYRCAAGEIDIVAKKKSLLIFVEVKTRASGAHAAPIDAVDRAKQRHVISSARCFLREKKLFDVEYRYDVVSVVWGDGPKPERVEHHEGAFSEGRR